MKKEMNHLDHTVLGNLGEDFLMGETEEIDALEALDALEELVSFSDMEDESKKMESMISALETKNQQLNAEVMELRREKNIEMGLEKTVESGDIRAIRHMIETDKIQFGENQEILSGLADQIDELRLSNPFLFSDEHRIVGATPLESSDQNARINDPFLKGFFAD